MRRTFKQTRHRMIKKHASVPIAEAKPVIKDISPNEEAPKPVKRTASKKEREVIDVDLQDS